MPKFRIKKVESFARGSGAKRRRYKPGDIVELPERYAGYDFTERVEEPVAKEEAKPAAEKSAAKKPTRK